MREIRVYEVKRLNRMRWIVVVVIKLFCFVDKLCCYKVKKRRYYSCSFNRCLRKSSWGRVGGNILFFLGRGTIEERLG